MKNKFTFFILLISIVALGQKQWTLEECVAHALDKNLKIQQTKLNYKNSEIDVKNANANFLPTLNFSSSSNLNFGSTFDPVSNNRVSTTIFGGSVGLNSGITIFDGFKNLNTYKLAKLGVTESRLNLKLVQNDISLQIANLYLNVLFSKENLNVAKLQLKISNDQLKRVEAQFELGAVAKGELLNYKSTYANDKQRLIGTENNLKLSLFNISQLMQISDVNFDVKKIEANVISEQLLYDDYNVVYEKALKGFPEIEKAKVNLQQANISIKIAKASYLPIISASANVSSNFGLNLDLPPGFENVTIPRQLDNNLGYGIGLGIRVPIFTGFRNDNNLAKSKLNKSISENQLENQKLLLKQRIQKSYLDAKLALNTFETSKVLVKTQKEAFSNSQVSLEHGAITLFDFEQIRNRLVNAESTLIRAKYDYIFKTKVLNFYFGKGIYE